MSLSTPVHLADLPTFLQRTDPGQPRITWYVTDGSPADGERVELSGAVLVNWASKAANLLQDELDAGPGSTVLLDLPPHWRALYWAVAAWHVGATVITDGEADVVVTTDPGRWPDAESLVVVTLPALARAAVVPVPAGAIDEARELASYGDSVTPYGRADGADTALDHPHMTFTCADPGADLGADLGADPGTDPDAARRLAVVGPDTALGPWLARAGRNLARGGSLVVVRVGDEHAPGPRVEAIAAQERSNAPLQ